MENNWITNISLRDIIYGNHPKDENTILIQIADRCLIFPYPEYKNFKHIFKYDFQDVCVDGAGGIYKEQAKGIADDLKFAKENGYNIVVHCHDGLCRSGAVVEVAEMIGFVPLHNNRIPNAMVKRKLMDELLEEICAYQETKEKDE